MLVACRLASLSALETYYEGSERARNSGRHRAPANSHWAGAGGRWGGIAGPKGLSPRGVGQRCSVRRLVGSIRWRRATRCSASSPPGRSDRACACCRAGAAQGLGLAAGRRPRRAAPRLHDSVSGSANSSGSWTTSASSFCRSRAVGFVRTTPSAFRIDASWTRKPPHWFTNGVGIGWFGRRGSWP